MLKNYIAGKLVPAVSGLYLLKTNPATGEEISSVPDSDERDVAIAVEAANLAFPEWSDRSVDFRSAVISKIADLIEARTDELALAETNDTGKPIALSKKMDIPRAASNFRYFAQAITQFQSETHDMGSQGFNYTLRRPVGVAGLISPWNLPLYLFSWKIAPAIASGNTAVAKPSEITPTTAHLLAEICIEAGLPAGVLNIVHGLGPKVGASIVSHPNVPLISFTGSTATGKSIIETAGPMFKKLSLEMGGKNPNLVFADCDFNAAVKGSVRAAFTNQGQICLCGSRILVEDKIFDSFLEAFIQETRKMKIGDPLEANTKIGAIVSRDQFEKDMKYIEIARNEGGKIVTGGKIATAPNDRCSGGYFIEPTVITGLNQNCRTNQEEIFGPVVTIAPFHSEKEALEMANSTQYGLSATVWTENLKRAHRVSAELHAGIVWINSWLVRDLRTPFGGVKNSGIGREGGMEALRFFTESKNIFVQM